jgi:hypothetical protein
MRKMIQVIAACAAVALGPAARAAVVVTMLPEPLEIREELWGRFDPIDVDGNGTVDFTFSSAFSGVGLRTERANRAIYRIDPPPNIGGPLQPLPQGYMIGTTLDPADMTDVAWRSSDILGGYVDPDEMAFILIVLVVSTGSESAFPEWGLRAPVGIEFEIDGNIHYGYLDITAGKGYAGITLHGWAYETEPGVPIIAALVPEPSYTLMVGVGLLSLIARRTRKKKEA